MATPIEDRILWSIHRAAAARAKTLGACWWCQHEAGFAATDAHQGKPRNPCYCQKCKGKVG